MDIIRKMILTTPVNGFVGCSAALGDHDFRPLMPKVKNPVLWMCGEKDGHNAAAMKVMQDELPGSKYVVLPGAGHISNMDQPEMFTRNAARVSRGLKFDAHAALGASPPAGHCA